MSPGRTGESHDQRDDGVLVIEEHDVVVLQLEPKVSSSDLENMVFNGFSAMSRMRSRGGEWLAFIATDATHWAGKTLWLGLTESVPLHR